MSNIFNKKEYDEFLEKAYKQADMICVDLDSVIEDTEKFARLYSGIKDTKEETENELPYTRLILNKKYEIYEYLHNINNWEEFSSMDEENEMSVWNIEFVKNDVSFAAITSHYRAYDNEFYFFNETESRN